VTAAGEPESGRVIALAGTLAEHNWEASGSADMFVYDVDRQDGPSGKTTVTQSHV
jgi:hypothetical protein